MIPDIMAGAGDIATIPCLATDPRMVDLHLETCDGQQLPTGMRYSASTETGISMLNVQPTYKGCYVCVGFLKEKMARSMEYKLNVRLGERHRQREKDTVFSPYLIIFIICILCNTLVLITTIYINPVNTT